MKTRKIYKLKTSQTELIDTKNINFMMFDKDIKKFKFSEDKIGNITLHIKWRNKEEKYEDVIGTYNINIFFKEKYKEFNYDLLKDNYKLKFIIPVGERSKKQALDSLEKMMSSFKEDVDFDDDNGEILINYKDGAKIEIEPMTDEQIQEYNNKLKNEELDVNSGVTFTFDKRYWIPIRKQE